MSNHKSNIELIKSTGVFDKAWYLSEYPDVASLGMDPVEHYLQMGAQLLRNPSSRFDTKQYVQANPELEHSGVNPLVHYAGTLAKINASPRKELKHDDSAIKGFLDRLDATGLAGWAVDVSRPGKPVELSVLVDNVEFMTVKTSIARNDVSAKGMRGECAGFSLAWPAGLFSPGVQIDVRTKQGHSLAKSPRTLEGDAEAQPRRSDTRYLEAYRDGQILPVTVIVPIYNAFDAVVDCLDSLERHLAVGSEILLINDCSTDSRIVGLLNEYSLRPNFHIHHNPENLGYTRTVNKAIAMCRGRDVILLNSDTVVTERWIDGLRYCAYARPRVATVTALSDNAGAFSAPEMGKYNPIPAGMNPDQFARLVTRSSEGRLLEVPTGNGFCFYIRRKALDEIGDFDAQKFPRGYGEENDLCMRALRRGWLNIVSDKVYVFHKRSQSFQGEKAALMESGAKAVHAAFPEYRTLTQRFNDAEFSYVRYRIRTSIAGNAENIPLPRIMYVISTLTGGTPQTNMDLMRAMAGKYECLLLRCDSHTITLSALVDDKLEVREVYKLSRPIDPISHRSDEYDRIVLDMMYRHSVALLHIRHIGWHSMGLVDAAKSIGIPVVYSAHDFYSVCPSLNLLDENLKYCGGKCTSGEGTCQIALWPSSSLPPLKNHFIGRWREGFGEFMAKCDEMITTAPSAKQIITDVFPGTRNKITVIPHGRDFDEFVSCAQWPSPGEKVRVLVPGNIGLAKGAKLITEIVELDKEGRFEFHFLGNTAGILANVGVHHGTYDRGSFASKVAAIAPHIGVIFSVWPETYCHTLTEMWSCSVPVFGFDVGAVGDRINASGAGWPLPLGMTAEEVLSFLSRSIADKTGFDEKVAAIKTWQATKGIWNDTSTMAVEYRRIYRRLLSGNTSAAPQRLALVMHDGNDNESQTVSSLLRSLSTDTASVKFDARPVPVDWVLAGGVKRIDALLLQAGAASEAQAAAIVEAARSSNVLLVYLAQDSLSVQKTASRKISPNEILAERETAGAADIILVSSVEVAAEFSSLAGKIQVISGLPGEERWLDELSRLVSLREEKTAASF